jgi:membrane protease YdiL (CAAX protease family)
LATRTLRIPRAFTREDGRERIAIPFWRGVLFALGSVVLGFAAAFVAMVVLIVAVVVITDKSPSVTPGHPLMAISEIMFYAVGGWLAWYGLVNKGIPAFRRLTRRDVGAIFIGIGALFVLRIGMAVFLVLTDHTKHVQAGFEHFDVTSKVPVITNLSVVLAILLLVVIGPIAEEITFRGLLFGALARRLGVLGSALITALLFGAVHGDLLLFPWLVALGFIAAIAYAATGNLWVPITLHAVHNSFGAAFLVATSLTKH